MKKASPRHAAPRAITGSDLSSVQAGLGIDVPQDIGAERVIRSGFINAGPSQSNRVLERHELDGNQGAFTP